MTTAVDLTLVLVAPFCAAPLLRLDTVPWPARWAAGAWLIGVVAFLLVAAGGSWRMGLMSALALAVAGAVVGLRDRRPGTLRAGALRSGWLLNGFWILLAAAAALLTVSTPVTETDAVAIWFPKVRSLLNGDALATWAAPDYPALGSTIWALSISVGGASDEFIGRTVLSWFYVGFAAALTTLFKPPRNPVCAWTTMAIVVAGLDHRMWVSGYQDQFLMTVAGLSMVFLVRNVTDASAAAGVVGAAMAGSLGLIKTEGSFLGVIIMATWVAAGVYNRGLASLRSAAPALAVGGALAVTWPIARAWHGIPIVVMWVPDSIDAPLLLGRLDRLPIIVRQYFTFPSQYYFGAASVLVAVLAWRTAGKARIVFAWTMSIVAMHLAMITGLFLITNADLYWHLQTAFMRMVGQHQGVLMVWLAAAAAAIEADRA